MAKNAKGERVTTQFDLRTPCRLCGSRFLPGQDVALRAFSEGGDGFEVVTISAIHRFLNDCV